MATEEAEKISDEASVPALQPSSNSSSHDESTTAAGKEYGSTPQHNAGADMSKIDSKPAAQSEEGDALAGTEDEDAPYRHLPPAEAEILKRQAAMQQVQTGFATIWEYADIKLRIIIYVSLFAAIVSGAPLPIMTVVFGLLLGQFQSFSISDVAYDEFMEQIIKLVLYLVYIAIAQFVSTYIATVGFIYAGESVTTKIRAHYLESCLNQNIAYYDKLGTGEVVTRITTDMNMIQEGISEKVGLTVTALATFVGAYIVGFVMSWQITLILTSTFLAIVVNMGFWGKTIGSNARQNVAAYGKGNTIVEEVISSIRNAVAFGTQDRLANLYDVHLIEARKFGFRQKRSLAFMIAIVLSLLYLTYALAFWSGTFFLIYHGVSLANLLTTTMAILFGSFNVGNITPNLQAFTHAMAAAAKIFATIQRQSPLNPSSDDGEKPDEIKGEIRFENVKHIYPSRPGVVVVKDLSLTIPAGKTTALVGTSGSGKSTIVGLVERFYSPVQGSIYLDGHDITMLNLRWMRQQMALVSQEPTLFATTIYENIRYGLIGGPFENESAEQQKERIINATKMSNAHDFISSLPEGYETNVGDRGFLLSGGQKQRIAIARAVVSDPKILLLDEATSALDTKSEGVVQAALDKAARGRTTITIAHRLSTIKHADNIVVMSEGSILEQGTHNELIKLRGAYSKLVSAQSISAANQGKSQIEEEEEEKIDQDLIRKASRKEAGGVLTDPDDDIGAKLNSATRTRSSVAVADAEKAEEAPAAERQSNWALIRLIASLNRPEWKWMSVGLFFSVIAGSGTTVGAVFYAKQITTLTIVLTEENRGQVKKDSDFWSAMYLMLAIVMLLALAIRGVIFADGSEKLIHRARDRAFRSLLRQDVAFFDRDENSAGALTSFLSTEAPQLAGLSGETLGTLMMLVTTLVSSVALSVAIGWKLALVCTAVLPVILSCGFFRYYLISAFQRRSKAAYVSSAAYASEAISAMRTVASLSREADVMTQYRASLASQERDSLRTILKTSLMYALSLTLVFLCLALGLWYGGTLLGHGEYIIFQLIISIMAVMFGGQSAGAFFSFAGEMGNSSNAAAGFKTLFDRRPMIDTWADGGEAVPSVDGTIEFRNVRFRYPTRLDQPVLRGLSLTVQPGQYVALVGASGCGKSTAIALLERFYDPIAGAVLVDGRDISSLNVNAYRSHLALVSQEPTLYQGTIRENIVMGSPRDSVPDADVEHVCREANIYDYIVSLPEGFNTVVGSKGSLLSGGQKQRIAIARALIRNPKILLLDEATSALDSESEHVVQAALDKAARGRTTITVAHRLSTIQNADVIYVFDKGRISEQGTHGELMKLGGRYTELVSLQSLGMS